MSCNSRPPRKTTIAEKYKPGNSNDRRVNSSLRLLLGIGGYGFLLEVDQRLNSHDTLT